MRDIVKYIVLEMACTYISASFPVLCSYFSQSKPEETIVEGSSFHKWWEIVNPKHWLIKKLFSGQILFVGPLSYSISPEDKSVKAKRWAIGTFHMWNTPLSSTLFEKKVNCKAMDPKRKGTSIELQSNELLPRTNTSW